MGQPATEAPARRSAVTRDDDGPIRSAILEAGVSVMARHGYHGTTVRDIAATAGVSAAHLYNHFPSKHDLLVTISDRAMDLLLRATEEAMFASGTDPADRLSSIVAAHVRVHLAHPREALVCNSELRSLSDEGRALILAKRDIQQRMFDRVVADGVERGVFPTEYPVEASRWIVSACTAISGWYHADGPLNAAELVLRHQRLALDSVGYRKGRACAKTS